MDIKKLLNELTLEEKAALLSGTNFMETNPIPRLEIPGLVTADGPHGLRKQIGKADNGVSQSEAATSFPTSAALACSWNVENAEKIGGAIADECLYYGVNVLLGPGVNIKKNPLCGRNFEYYSEDPLLSGEMGAAFVNGVQSRGVGVSLKHFAANNAEKFRFIGESVVDERALREIYLKAYEIIVKQAKPYTMMCAYNKLWGEFCSENKRLLTDILRNEWGFDGVVMTDWGAAKDRALGVEAGLDLEMPGDTPYGRKCIIDGVKNGGLSEESLDKAAGNMLRLIKRCAKQQKARKLEKEKHHALAGEIAKDSAVLLKNDGALPLNTEHSFLVAGDLFAKMRYQGAGSSMISPAMLTTPKDAFDKRKINYEYSRGYAENQMSSDAALLQALEEAAKKYDTVLFFCGLTDYAEGEGGDRQGMSLPQNQLDAINALLKAGKELVLVLFGGSPVELPFADGAKAILNMYLPGQNGGDATAALLFGEANPCGKLAESWPLSYADVPFGNEYSKNEIELYRESIFVGYRYYATAQRKPRYPFGFGLSYTGFEYKNLKLEERDGLIYASCDIGNTGAFAGGEIVQLYVQGPKTGLPKPLRELRAFCKLYLEPGQTKQALMSFPKAELSYFNPEHKGWVLENGEYVLEIAASSEDIRLSSKFTISGEKEYPSPYSEKTAAVYSDLSDFKVDNTVFEELLGRKIPVAPPPLPLHIESIFTDFNKTFMGRILFNSVLSVANRQDKKAEKMPEGPERDNRIKGAMFLRRILSTNSPRSLSMSGGKAMPHNFAMGFVELANGHLFRGVKCFLSKIKVPPLPKETAKQQKE